MANKFKYVLKKSGKKDLCPNCGKHTLVRYVENDTGSLLPEQYGRCDREVKCSYHFNPYLTGYATRIKEVSRNKEVYVATGLKSTSKEELTFVPSEVLMQTLNPDGYEYNNFIQNLFINAPYPFNKEDVEKVVSQYYIGTVQNGYRAGAITFPFVDIGGKVRAIQVKVFDKTNHTTETDFLHSIIEKHHRRRNEPIPAWIESYKKNELKVSCLFGEHLLSRYSLNPIALVEAPKTAIYATLYFGFPEQPENLLWLAVYNLSSLNFEKCRVLAGRKVFLFPDLSGNGKAFQLWTKKAKEFSSQMPETRFEVSPLLETLAPNSLKENGGDLADVLIKMDWRKFRSDCIAQKKEPVTIPNDEKGEKGAPSKTNFFLQTSFPPEVGNRQERTKEPNPASNVAELVQFFSNTLLPGGSIKLDTCSTIIDINKFVDSHLSIVKAHDGNPCYEPYLERLNKLKSILTINAN